LIILALERNLMVTTSSQRGRGREQGVKMKVTLRDKEIMSYALLVNIEVEGEQYTAEIAYDTHNGYEVSFLDEQHKRITSPEWANKYEEESVGDSLGYWLESMIGGWFEWTPAKEEVSA
jgi:hypothetical protein